jgi:hypothetical protein
VNRPNHIAGVWRGSYFYDNDQQRAPDGAGVGFELHLRQSWLQGFFGWFSGTVTDESQRGMPGIGNVRGSFRGQSIRFTKRMPVSYVTHEGHNISVRDWLRKQGYDPGFDVPHCPIFYHGTFSIAESASGNWRITAGHLHVSRA